MSKFYGGDFCLGDQGAREEVGKLYTPADAVAEGLTSLSLNETKIFARTIRDRFRLYETWSERKHTLQCNIIYFIILGIRCFLTLNPNMIIENLCGVYNSSLR